MSVSDLANSTVLAAPDTYFGIYNELSKYNVHLNMFERLWAVCYPFIAQFATVHPANYHRRAGTHTCKTM